MKTSFSLVASLLLTSLTNASPASDPNTTTQCLSSKSVPYKTSQDANYTELSQTYNLRLQYKPLAIVLPTTNQHVQDAVVCASQGGVKVQAKSGGHSYASFSAGGQDGSMIIDLQALQTIDVQNGTATVGGGVRLGNLANGLYNQGQQAMAHGTCPGVGIGGHFTHGGYGPSSRHWGLALDQILAMDVVLADGRLVKASPTENTDIWWAMRGAGESFGIVTTFYLQTHAAPSSVTYFSFSLNNVFDSKDTWTNTFLHLQDVATNSSVIDSRLSFRIYLDNYHQYVLSGLFFGDLDEFESRIQPELLRTLPSSNSPTVQRLSWIDYLIKESNAPSLAVSTTDYNEHSNFFTKSITVPESSPMTKNALDALYDYLKTSGDVRYYLIIALYGGPGSAINTKDTNFSAYADRDALWVWQNWGFDGTSINFINGVNAAIINAQPQTSFGAYLNYVDPSYDPATAHKLYYGDAVYGRLAGLKKQYDPNSVFWNPQAIGT